MESSRAPALADFLHRVLLVHAAATLFLTGLIWTVQIVHYPLFAQVGDAHFPSYERSHVERISWIVGPPMAVEALSALALAALLPSGPGRRWATLGLLLLAVIWLSTALLQVPLHNLLARGLDREAVARLVQTNWIRTAAWSARAVVSLALLRYAMR